MSATPPSATAAGASGRPAFLHYGFAIALLAGLSMFASFGLGRFTYGLLLPAMKEALALSYTESSLLASANLATYIVAAPVAGALASRFGPRPVIVAGLLGLAAALFGLSLTPGFLVAFICLAAIGFFAGLGVVPALGAVAAWFAPRLRGLGMGIALAIPALSYVLTGIIVPPVVATDPVDGWRQIWVVSAVLTAAIALIVALALRNTPAERGQAPVGGPAPLPPAAPSGTKPGIRTVLSIGPLRLLAALYCCFGFAYVVYSTFMPAYLRTEGIDPAVIGRLWTVIGVAALLGPTAFGWLSDRIGRRYGLALLMALLGIVQLTLIAVPPPAGTWVSAIGYGFVLFSTVAVVAAAGGDYAGPVLASGAIGFATMVMGFGQTAGPLVVGPIIDLTQSFVPGFLGGAGIAFLGALLGLLLPRPEKARAEVAAVVGATAPVTPPTDPVPHMSRSAGSATTTASAPPEDWVPRAYAQELDLNSRLLRWAAEETNPDRQEVYRLLAARARDRAFQLRRAYPAAVAGIDAAPDAAPQPADDMSQLASVRDHAPEYPAGNGHGPESLPARLAAGVADSLDLLTGLVRWPDHHPAGNGLRLLERDATAPHGPDRLAYQPDARDLPAGTRFFQSPGRTVHLDGDPSPRLLVALGGAGRCRPDPDSVIDLTPGRALRIDPDAAPVIETTDGRPLSYVIFALPRTLTSTPSS